MMHFVENISHLGHTCEHTSFLVLISEMSFAVLIQLTIYYLIFLDFQRKL